MAWKSGEGMELEAEKGACLGSVVGATGRTGATTTMPVPQNRHTPGLGPWCESVADCVGASRQPSGHHRVSTAP